MLTEILPTTLPPIAPPKEPNRPKNYPPKEFDWLVTLQELVNGRPYTGKEHANLQWRAMDWPTCACGQLCKALPRSPNGRPEDDILFTYGIGFYQAVKLENWETALFLFHRIEARTTYLLNEQRIILDNLQSRG